MQTKVFVCFFHNVFCRLLLLSYFSQMESFEPNPGPGAGPLGSRRPNAGIHRSAANLFVPVFVSLIVCVYTHFCPWPSRVFSPTLAIFCLVAPNMPLCISAVRTQLIYIRLHLLEVTTENYIYFKRADITHQRLFVCRRGKKKNKKGVYFLVMYLWNGFARRREFDQI